MRPLVSDSPPRVGAVPAATRPTLREFVRYAAASGGALIVDVGLYRLAMGLGLAYPLAALIGFCAGAVVAYVASVAWVFESRSLRRPGVEFGVFVAIGVAGLGLTELLLWLQIERLGLPPLWSRIGAAGGVFLFNFTVRKTMLFRARRPR